MFITERENCLFDNDNNNNFIVRSLCQQNIQIIKCYYYNYKVVFATKKRDYLFNNNNDNNALYEADQQNI